MSSPERSGRHKLQPVQQASSTRRNRNRPSDQALLDAVWLISHFGWIAEATIRRTLMISGGQSILATGLSDRLRQLLNSGWVERRERRDNDLGIGEPEWRLTDSGRDVLAHRG